RKREVLTGRPRYPSSSWPSDQGTDERFPGIVLSLREADRLLDQFPEVVGDVSAALIPTCPVKKAEAGVIFHGKTGIEPLDSVNRPVGPACVDDFAFDLLARFLVETVPCSRLENVPRGFHSRFR